MQVCLCLSSLTYKKEQKHHNTNLTAINRNEYDKYVIVRKLFYSVTRRMCHSFQRASEFACVMLHYTLSIEN